MFPVVIRINSIMIKQLLSSALSAIPVSSNILVFNSFPDYSDNAYAMFLYIYNKYGSKYRYVWLVNEANYIENIIEDNKNRAHVSVIYKKSLKGIFLYLRAKHVFYTHGIFESVHICQTPNKMINLWHGMPLKRIGLMDGKPLGYMHNLQYTIATSPLFQRIMADSFGVDCDHVLLTGQPRCDLFNLSTDFFETNAIKEGDYKSIGVWMPTYRNSIVKNEIRQDGTFKDGCIAFMDEVAMERLNKTLVEDNHLLIIKLHPMDALQLYDFNDYSNIKIIKQKDFHSQLYPFLSKCDYLLTDFSSVWVDYELCRKPIGFIIDDLECYTQSRGLTIDNFSEIIPGVIIKDYEELVTFITNPKSVCPKVDFNTYKDFKSSERIAKFLNL